MLIAEQIINVMKERPDCRIEFSELKKIFEEFMQPISKIIKSPEFRKYVKTELVSKYCYSGIWFNLLLKVVILDKKYILGLLQRHLSKCQEV